ncbi:MAG: hypothetical protein HQL52_12660 [Magnetococcales bacterium]|nr:hypothetical protein [Magnetococcales bacterium]
MKKPAKKQVIELDGKAYLIEGDQATVVDPVNWPKGDHWIVSDLGGAEPRVQDVATPAKYAVAIVQRQLRENGHFTAPPKVLPHWCQNTGADSSRLYFSAVDSKTFQGYFTRLADQADQPLLFPMNGLLLATQRGYGQGCVAVFLLHGRFLELLVGEGHRLWTARRLTVYSQDRSAMAGLADSLANELRSIEGEHNLKISQVVGLLWGVEAGEKKDPGLPQSEAANQATSPASTEPPALVGGKNLSSRQWPLFPAWLDDLEQRLQRPVTLPPVSIYGLADGGRLVTSLPDQLRSLKVADALNPLLDKLLYRAHRLLPLATIITAVAAGMVFMLTISSQHETDRQEQIAEDLIQQIRQEMPTAPKGFSATGLGDQIRFGKTLLDLQQKRQFAQVLADLTNIQSAPLHLDRVNLQYEYGTKGGLTVTLNGRFEAPFEAATAAHQAYMAELEKRGYQLLDGHFEGSLEQVVFSMKLRAGDNK